MLDETRGANLAPLFEKAEVVSAGCDWITVTGDMQEGLLHFTRLFTKLAAQRERLGDAPKSGGFQGYAGHSCGPYFLGQRPDGCLFKVNGSVAKDVFWLINKDLAHFTRLDLQVTVRLPWYRPDIARVLGDRRFDAHVQAAADRDEEPGDIVPKQRLEDGYGQGDTLYIGSRSSPRFGRVYDKEKQSGDEWYARCWRFEVEYKRVMAPLAATALRDALDPQQRVLDLLKGQFDAWGIECPVNAVPELVAGSVGRREVDNDRSLTWLRNQVRPTVERLLGTMDVQDVLQALNIDAAALARHGYKAQARRAHLSEELEQRRISPPDVADEIPF